MILRQRSGWLSSADICALAGGLAATEPHAGGQGGAAWSPCLVGALIGVLSMLTFYFSDKPLGVSTAYARLSGLIGRLFVAKRIAAMPYYQKTKPIIDWEVMLLIGVIVGAFIAAWSGSDLQQGFLPPRWVERFGADSQLLRGVFALSGGVLLAIGARLAGGCTSGHGISGTLQLSVGSWISVLFFFIGGMAVAMPLFR